MVSAAQPPSEAQLSNIPKAFATAQHGVSSHRRTIKSLHKTFEACAAYMVQHKGQTRYAGEKAFMTKFRDCIHRILPVKKGEPTADRSAKFIQSFVALGFQLMKEQGKEDEETPVSRLVYALIKHLLPGLEAANKIVRYRTLQVMNSLLCAPDLDEDLYATLMDALLLRLRDRESSVRLQAVACLSKLSPDALLPAMTDPSAEVRRGAIYSCDAVDQLVTRIRDVDIHNRKMVCNRMSEISISDLVEPATRKAVLQACKDREEVVRKAAGKMVVKWMADDTLEHFLRHFDLSQEADEAQAALEVALRTRPDLLSDVSFPEEFWRDLTPRKAFLARVVCQHFQATNSSAAEEHLPVATALAHYIKFAWYGMHQADDSEEVEAEREFVLDQLLQLACMLDFTDEAGRRAMMDGFIDDERRNGVRAMISDTQFPQSLFSQTFDLLSKLVDSDSAFISIIVEVVQDLREEAHVSAPTPEPEDSDEDSDLDVEESLKTPARPKVNPVEPPPDPTTLNVEHAPIHIRCLLLVRHLLERVIAPIRENPMLKGMVHEVIVPAIRTKEENIRYLGIRNLGLCCLLDREMATESFGLFINQALEKTITDDMRESVYRIIFDILLLYGIDFLQIKGYNPENIFAFLESALEGKKEVQAITAVGICKLLLSGTITDITVLNKLVIVYFAPETADNQALRQCLTYHFPAYCYSSTANQRRMASIVVPALDILVGTYEELEDEGMVPPAQIAAQLIDWTDPSKQVDAVQERDLSIHATLAVDFLKAVYSRKTKDERKRYCQLLGKLNLPEQLDPYILRNLTILLKSISEERPLADTVSRNALNRFEASLNKLYGNSMEALDDVQVEEANDVTKFIEAANDEAARQAEQDEYQEEEPARPKRKKPTPKPRATSKRSRSVSQAPSEPAEDDEPAPRRSTRASSSTARNTTARRVNKVLAEEGIDEEEAEDEDDGEAEVQVEKTKPPARRRRASSKEASDSPSSSDDIGL